jgi:hypothetical protein
MTKASNAPAPAANLEKFNALLGKKLSAYGWQYDNDGRISGTITSIEPARYRDNIKVSVEVDPSDKVSTDNWEFTPWQMENLLVNGEFDSQGWTSGMSAYVKA